MVSRVASFVWPSTLAALVASLPDLGSQGYMNDGYWDPRFAVRVVLQPPLQYSLPSLITYTVDKARYAKSDSARLHRYE